MDDALLSAAPPPPVAAPAGVAAATVEPAPDSVAALLDDTLDGTFDPESWSDDTPLSQGLPHGEAPTARLDKRPPLPSLAYLEGEDTSRSSAATPI